MILMTARLVYMIYIQNIDFIKTNIKIEIAIKIISIIFSIYLIATYKKKKQVEDIIDEE